jgi:hypothetical protein
MNILEFVKNQLLPKKLWMLRFYVTLLTILAEVILFAYIGLSLYNLMTSDEILGNLILGYGGLYLVWVCLVILFVAQVVSLFLNIHDNIEDVRNKAIDPEYKFDLSEDRERGKIKMMKSIFIIAAIGLSIVLSIVNLNSIKNNVPYGQIGKEQLKFIKEYREINSDSVKGGNEKWEEENDLMEDYKQVKNWVGILHKAQNIKNYGIPLSWSNHIKLLGHEDIELHFNDDYPSILEGTGNNDTVVFSGEFIPRVKRGLYVTMIKIKLKSISTLPKPTTISSNKETKIGD